MSGVSSYTALILSFQPTHFLPISPQHSTIVNGNEGTDEWSSLWKTYAYVRLQALLHFRITVKELLLVITDLNEIDMLAASGMQKH